VVVFRFLVIHVTVKVKSQGNALHFETHVCDVTAFTAQHVVLCKIMWLYCMCAFQFQNVQNTGGDLLYSAIHVVSNNNNNNNKVNQLNNVVVLS